MILRTQTRERTVELAREAFVFQLAFFWPPNWWQRLLCWRYGHRDMWNDRYRYLGVCRWCGKVTRGSL